jgi:hypothetical protein
VVLALPSAMARFLIGMRQDDVVATVQEKMAEIGAELKPFEASDFQAKVVEEERQKATVEKSDEPEENDCFLQKRTSYKHPGRIFERWSAIMTLGRKQNAPYKTA